jgi:hypothetical protein
MMKQILILHLLLLCTPLMAEQNGDFLGSLQEKQIQMIKTLDYDKVQSSEDLIQPGNNQIASSETQQDPALKQN